MGRLGSIDKCDRTMKYVRSSKCHYSKWLTADKQSAIKELLEETHRVVSWAIDKHHLSIAHCGMEKKHLLLASNLHECESWLTERAKKNCFTQEPEPVEADTGDLIYWFKICEEDDDITTLGIDDEGQITDIFMGIPEKDFEYDDTFKILCPDCVIEESGQLEDEDYLE